MRGWKETKTTEMQQNKLDTWKWIFFSRVGAERDKRVWAKKKIIQCNKTKRIDKRSMLQTRRCDDCLPAEIPSLSCESADATYVAFGEDCRGWLGGWGNP